MNEQKVIDHLFRHQYGKMVSILTRIFGLSNLEMIEDAVQDTFVQAILKWRNQIPENPEAWLTKAAKHRAIDLLRKIKAEEERVLKLGNGPSALLLDDLFLEHEVEDSQLRIIFTACHPALNPRDQIAFALKTISGFSAKEIASALLLKEATIKKSLTRARQSIRKNKLSFDFPSKKEVPDRIERVLEVLYLIFNEGFHSGRKDILIRKDLCGEAIRLCKMVLKKEHFRTEAGYSLFGLMCFHAARLESRLNAQNEIINFKNQNRKKWHFPLIALGNQAMLKAEAYENEVSTYYFEAAIAMEHIKAKAFETTDWNAILLLYRKLYSLYPTPFTALNMAIVLMQLEEYEEAYQLLKSIDHLLLEQRAYLYFSAMADYYTQIGQTKTANIELEKALGMVRNEAERNYLIRKKASLKL